MNYLIPQPQIMQAEEAQQGMLPPEQADQLVQSLISQHPQAIQNQHPNEQLQQVRMMQAGQGQQRIQSLPNFIPKRPFTFPEVLLIEKICRRRAESKKLRVFMPDFRTFQREFEVIYGWVPAVERLLQFEDQFSRDREFYMCWEFPTYEI